MELKRALTYEDQINKLIHDHKLIITNESYAKEILKKVNYYRLSGYGIGLKKLVIKNIIKMVYRLNIFSNYTVLTVNLKIIL